MKRNKYNISHIKLLKMIKKGKLKEGTKIYASDFVAPLFYENGTLYFYNCYDEREPLTFKDFIENHDFFYIIGHKEPDGDCVSSCLGIARIIEKFNKKYKLLSAGPFKKVEIKKFETLFHHAPLVFARECQNYSENSGGF